MCSISGILQLETRERSLESPDTIVRRMNTAQRHRGPDDEGIACFSSKDKSLQGCFGNTRLAIIDLSAAGHQPMQDPEGGSWLTYNGETYNSEELRRDIGDDFGSWRSNCDTEVVLRAYRKWDRAAFSRLRGMFAMAIWDAEKEELVLARDEFGIKPLYYTLLDTNQGLEVKGQNLLFASELKALLASQRVPPKLSQRGIASFFRFGSLQAPLTAVANVFSLMPGEMLRATVQSTGIHIQVSRWKVEESSVETPVNRRQAVVTLREQLEESLRLHLASDVPLGVFLSGGMDSSALVALMSRVAPQKPKTFSVVFDEQEYNEAPHSRVIAEKFKTDHSEVHLSEKRLLRMLPSAIESLDQPTMDGINTYAVSKAIKDAGITVALSGLGGDELFGGYPTFHRALRIRKLNSIQRGLLKAFSTSGKGLSNGTVSRRKFWELVTSNGTPSDVYRISRELFSPVCIERLMCDRPVAVEEATCNQEASDVVNAISKLELQGYMANTLLRDTDFMSMAHSLEVRVPLVDKQVADYVLSLPGEWKLNGSNRTVPKPLLADAVDDLLPREFLTRPKMGFTLPFEKWMTSELRMEISSVFNDEFCLAHAGINQAPVKTLWQKFLQRPKAVGWSRPWSLYVLARWCELNNVKVA